nr:carboxymuconolactone decarboxylase family protein [Elioraea rosea]
MRDWLGFRSALRGAVAHITKAHPELIKGFGALNHASKQTKHLDAKTREFIALGVAITTHCEGCINAHVEAALKAGATREEIAEALGVAIALNAGAALTYAGYVMDAVEAHSAIKTGTAP